MSKVSRQWHEVCGLLMAKMGVDHVVITEDDFDKNCGFHITAEIQGDTLHVSRIPDKVAEQLMILHRMPPSSPN